jgi:hypothetical protein
MRAWPARRVALWSAVVAAALLTGLIAWLARPSSPAVPGAERVRQYVNVRACLLTGADGVTRGPASVAWASMQSASAATRAMVSYLPAAGAGAGAGTYLASLAQRQCSVIVAVGRPQVAAVAADAARFRQIRFVVIAGRAAGANVTGVQPATDAAIHSTISHAISAAVGRGPAS